MLLRENAAAWGAGPARLSRPAVFLRRPHGVTAYAAAPQGWGALRTRVACGVASSRLPRANGAATLSTGDDSDAGDAGRACGVQVQLGPAVTRDTHVAMLAPAQVPQRPRTAWRRAAQAASSGVVGTARLTADD